MPDSSLQFDPMERSETLGQQAYQRLKTAIMSGTFAPGQKITTRNIASALGISPTPAREAIGQLVAERALDFDNNRTAVVPTLDKGRIAEIYEIRIALEGLAAEVAAPFVDDDGLQILTQYQLTLVAAMERKDFKTILSVNEKFHFAIYCASGRPLLVQMIETLWLRMGPMLNLLFPEFAYTRARIRYHEEAIKALRAGDAKGLRRAISTGLAEGADNLILRIDQLDSE